MIPIREIESTQDARTPPRYLVLGSIGYGGVESVDWIEGELPNIVDYDLIIVDVPALTLDRLKSIDSNRLNLIRSQLAHFLYSGGKLIVITNERIYHKRPKRYPEEISNFDWCPINIKIKSERGKSIVIRNEIFKNYLTLLSEWDYYIFIPHSCLTDSLTYFFGKPDKTKYNIPCIPIIENRYDKVLAGRYNIEVRYEQTKSSGYGSYKEYPKEPDHLSGDIFLIPRINGIDNRKAISLLLEEVTGLPQQTLPPEWADNLIVPGVPILIADISEKHQQISTLEKEISELEKKLSDLNNYKQLLYCDGVELEIIVQRCFEEIGGQVVPAKYSQEEFILIYKGNEYLVEIKGSLKSIALKHLRQLNDYLLKYQEDTGKICKGILFGNAWRSIPPNGRNAPNTLLFPNNLVKRAEEWNVALVSSIDFFKAFLNFIEHDDGDSLLVALTSQKGIVTFN
jgi:hypothetical protein